MPILIGCRLRGAIISVIPSLLLERHLLGLKLTLKGTTHARAILSGATDRDVTIDKASLGTLDSLLIAKLRKLIVGALRRIHLRYLVRRVHHLRSRLCGLIIVEDMLGTVAYMPVTREVTMLTIGPHSCNFRLHILVFDFERYLDTDIHLFFLVS